MSSPVIWMVPPLVPLSLPVAVILPETLTVCFGSAGGLGRGGAAEHDLAVAGADRIGLDHAAVVDDGVDDVRARRRR